MPSRRRFLSAALSGATATVLPSVEAAQSPTTPLPPDIAIHDDADLDRHLAALSNWGRWGPDDQLGTLNYITPAMRLAAVKLVRTGHIIPLAREIPVAAADGVRRQTYEMRSYTDALPEESGCIDYIGMVYHGFAITHLDALCHLFTPEGKQGMYNGFPISAVTPQGATKLGVEVMGAQGIAGRGVLLDIAALKGGPLPPGSTIWPADLDAAERAQKLVVREGDILFIRNGAGARNALKLGTGLHASCLPWLRERRIAVVSSDSDSDVHPAPPGFKRWTEPVHMVAIPYLGLPILDNTDLDALALHCAQEGRWEFFVTVGPWRFKGATSSPVNPIAMF
ncbi:polyketide cyclase [Caballeronia terrestris]|uniref:Polyketide cyclase n=1 Tax=Caballeronia terrestris TaxID=1226301 RepID=A0A158K7T3_9BURK|nr:cyclase family protein [Caballeronia terrestris]SAL77186.1 polyketide cyclase [Caballeronia terrestris]